MRFETRRNERGAEIVVFGRLDVAAMPTRVQAVRAARVLRSDARARECAVRIEGAIKDGITHARLPDLVACATIRGKDALSSEIGTLDADALALWDRVQVFA